MTMFYSDADERFLERRRAEREEQRMRKIANEEMNKRLGEPDDCPPGHIRTIDGHLVRIEDAMKGPPSA